MMKRVFIIHGWGGNPEEGWFPWLKKELEAKGFTVTVPAMPNTDEPKIETWVPFLKEQIGKADENTYLVGHSMGCQTIMRYLEGLADEKIGGIVFAAGFFNLKNENLEDDEERAIAKPWLETPIDTNKILTHVDKITAVFSDNDDWVPLSDSEIFKERLKAKIIIEHNKSHSSRQGYSTDFSL